MDQGTPPLKGHTIEGHMTPLGEVNSDLTEIEQKTKEFVNPLFQNLSDSPLSRRTDLVFSRSPTPKSPGISQKEMNIENEMEPIVKQLESSIDIEKKLEEVTGKPSTYLIEEFHSPSKLEQTTQEKINIIKNSSSETEKITTYGALVGSLIESVPLQLDAMENGAKDLCCEMFMEATKLLSPFESAKPFCTAGTVLLAKVLGLQIEDRIEKYTKSLNQLEKENVSSQDSRVIELKLKITELQKSQSTLLPGLSINDSVDFMKENIEKAVKQITPIFPKGEKTFANIWNFSDKTCELIRLGATAITVKQNYEAIQMLYLMKESLEKEKAKLEKGGTDTLEKRGEIEKLEKEIAEIEQKILSGQIELASSGISVFESVMKGLAVVLPSGSGIFLNFAGTLGLLSGGLKLGIPGRSIAVRIKKIRELCERTSVMEQKCKSIEEDIQTLQKSGQIFKFLAKKVLLTAMKVRLNTIQQIWVSHEIFSLTEDLMSFSLTGQGVAKDLLTLCAGKAAVATAGTVGLGLIAGNIVLKLSKLLLNEKSSVILWKEEMQLSRERKILSGEIRQFHMSSIPVLKKFLIFPPEVKQVEKKELEKICEEELSNVFKEQRELQKKLLENIKDPKQMKAIKIQVQKNALLESAIINLQEDISNFKGKEISVDELSKMRDEVFKQFATPILHEYEFEKQKIQSKTIEIQKNFEKSKKLELLGLSEEQYDGFRDDLEKLLDSPEVLFELSEEIRQEDSLLAEAIFGQKNVDLDLLVDYFIPPVGSGK